VNRCAIAIAAVLLVPGVASAKDKVRMVDSQPVVYDHYAMYHAQAEGYFDAEDLDVSVTLGRGGSAALQIVATGSADVVYGAGILSVIGAFAKGAPVTVIANGSRGADDTFWYVRPDSPIKSFKDLDGKDFTYSSPGSFTHLVVNTVAKEIGIKPKFVSTGTMSAVRTMLLSGQVDTGWSAFPTNVDILRAGQVRMIGTGSESPTLAGMTTRGITANSDWLAKNHATAVRLMRAIWKGQEFNFSGEKAHRRFADHWNLEIADVRQVEKFYKIEHHTLWPITNVEMLLRLAQEYDFIKEPLTEDQKKRLVTFVYDPTR
jgi:NitT/TauT family transport system substrate-binding protein